MSLPRRRFITLSALGIASSTVLSPWARAQAQKKPFSAKGRFETLPTPQPTTNPDKIEVVELFWYGCPHCSRFQPYIDPWQENRPDDVEFIRMPAIFRKDWEVHARAYYTALALGALDKTHAAVFGAIHGQNRRLESKEDIEQLFARQGVAPADFRKHYVSFGVDSGVRRSKVMQERYGIRGVPTVIVNGKYRVSGSLAGSYANMIKVLDILVAKERKEMLSN